jgi:anti-sigma regulatory factor (Ser/Thr protein kinase)
MEHCRGSARFEISVPAQTASLAQVRRRLRAFLAQHHVREDQRHGVVLVTHELTANAIVHGSTDEGQMIAIAITLEPRFVLIRVLDPAHTEAIPASLEPTGWRESGRGMLIVDQLATWSQGLHEGRRGVTAKLPLGL